MFHRVGSDIADGAVELACRPNVLARKARELGEALEQSTRRYALEELDDSRDRVARVHFDEEVDVVGHYLELVYDKAVFFRNLAEEHVARLFNEGVVEYRSSVLGHKHYVVGQLSKAMAIVV